MATAFPTGVDINYAQFYEIRSEPAAIIFAVVYFPLALFYGVQAIRRPTSVSLVLGIFCTIRIASFVMRALLTTVDSIEHNRNFFIAYQIIYNVGFFAILYSAYTLALDREALLEINRAQTLMRGPLRLFWTLIHNRMLIRLTVMLAVILGIVGVTDTISSSQSEVNTGIRLRKASIYIFLSVGALLGLLSVLYTYSEFSAYKIARSRIGSQFAWLLLMLVAALLLLRESFLAATINNFDQQNNEKLWYPLVALPEVLALILFAAPGFVPARSEIPEDRRAGYFY